MTNPEQPDHVSPDPVDGDTSGCMDNKQNPIVDLLVVAVIYLLFSQTASVILEKLSLISYEGIRGTVQAALLLGAVAILNSKYPLELKKYDPRLLLRFALIGTVLCFVRYIPFFISLITNPRITTDYSTYLKLSGLHFVWSLILLVVVGPLAEELVFRGYVFRLLQQKTSIRIAAGVSSLIFAAVHGIQTGWLINHFLLGLFCCFVYVRSNSVWASVITHVGNNAMWYVCTGLLVNKF
jgi:membrane protease YdiL (CAAX protease family)